MKMWKLIAIIMAIILAVGGIVTLFGRNDDSGGGLSVDLKKPEECVYNIATGAVPASEDPAGKGYEYFACAECGEMRKIAGNHKSGHYFRTLADGTKACSCGAILDNIDGGCVKNDFTAGTTTHPITLSWLSDGFIDNGRWKIHSICSSEGKQAALYASSNTFFSEILKGEYDGNVVTGVDLSFKILYTGTFERSGIFMNWQHGEAMSNAIFYQLFFSNQDGKLVACYEIGSPYEAFVLSPDVEYTFKFHLDLASLRAVMTVEGADLEESVIFDRYATREAVEEFRMMGISRYEFFCSDGSYKLYMDDLTIGCQVENIDDSAVNEETQCEHDFKVKGVVDYDHPASEAWKKYTCKDCGCWYYGH